MVSEDELELDTIEGIGPVTKQKLNDAGIYNLIDLAARGVGEVADALNGDVAKAGEMINRARNRLSELGVLAKDFISARELFQRRQNIERITTGSKALDELLGGGVEVGAVTEFYGEYGSGKCISSDTIIPYAIGSGSKIQLNIDEISKIYEIAARYREEVQHDDGFILPVDSFYVLGADMLPKKADFLYRERAFKAFKIKTSGGRKIYAASWHRFPVLKMGLVCWKKASEIIENDLIAVPKTSYHDLLYSRGDFSGQEEVKVDGQNDKIDPHKSLLSLNGELLKKEALHLPAPFHYNDEPHQAGLASMYRWDVVKEVEEDRYEGYIYDISVPDGHAYIGGNMPTLMHNSQVCHTLSVTVQLPREKGGLEAGAVYIDTEGTFRPERIAEIAEARGLDPIKVLDNIIVAKAYNSAHQELIVKELGRQFEKTKPRPKLVSVDSAVAHYRAEFLGRATLAERQQRLNRFMHTLLRIAELYSVAVVVTNQVQASPEFFFGDPTRATGGHVVAHTSTYRIYLRKAAKSRIARMVDSPYLPEREAVFIINNKGIDDPNEDTPKKRGS